jgi:D-3-phosphoglycerate dehydrogenase
MHNVFVTDHAFLNLDLERVELNSLATLIDLNPLRTEAELLQHVNDADALMVSFAPVTGKVMDASPNLKGILRYGVGFDNVDIPAATARGVWVANVPDYCIPEVADHAMAMLLTLARKLPSLDASVRRGEWAAVKTAKPIFRLEGRTLGLVGMGRIGREVARRARGFGLNVIVADKYLSADKATEAGATLVEFDQLIGTADYISIHAPLTPETHHLINAEVLRAMKPTALLINVSRGGIVDTVALTQALHEGTIAGAGIDVFEKEPLEADHPIRSAPNTVLAAHAAWYSEEAMAQLQRSAGQEVARMLRGERPKNALNSL